MFIKSLNGSDATIFGYKVWGDNCPKWVEFIYDVAKKVDDAKWWIQYRFNPEHKYNVVYTDLKPGYHCQDTRILHACMGILCDYIEEFKGKYPEEKDKDKSAEQIIEEFNKELRAPDNAWGGDCSDQADRQEKALKIYRWWKYEKSKDEAREEELCHLLYGQKENEIMTIIPCVDNPEMSEAIFRELTEQEKVWREEMDTLDKKIHDDEQSMLVALMEIRNTIWH